MTFSTDENADSDKKTALASVRDTIERRVNSFGVSEPLVQVQGSDQIVIELPGISNIGDAIQQIGQTPLLEFRTQGDPAKPQTATVGPDGKVVVDPLSGFSIAWMFVVCHRREVYDKRPGCPN